MELSTRAPCTALWAAGSEELSEFLEHRGLRLRADDLLNDLAAGEHVHRRDSHDPVLLRHGRVLVNVELDDVDLVGVLAGDLFQYRGHHPARPAPFGPVVHDYWLLALEDLFVESRVGHNLGRAQAVHFPCRLMDCVCVHDSWLASQRSASMAAAQPVPAAVTAWR